MCGTAYGDARRRRSGGDSEQGGQRQSADDVAATAGTIGYEIVTGIRRRVPRRYHRGGRVVAVRTLADGYRRL